MSWDRLSDALQTAFSLFLMNLDGQNKSSQGTFTSYTFLDLFTHIIPLVHNKVIMDEIMPKVA